MKKVQLAIVCDSCNHSRTYSFVIRMIKSVLFVGIALTMSNCSLVKPLDDPKHIKNINVEDMRNAAYMGRYMLTPKKRSEFLSQPFYQKHSIAPAVVGVGIDAATNSLSGIGPVLGGSLILGLQVLDVFGSDGSNKRVGNMFLPEKVDDNILSTADEARTYAKWYMVQKIHEFASSEKRIVTCFSNCKSFNMIYKLSKKVSDNNVAHDPKDLFIHVLVGKFSKANVDVMRDKSIGFKPQWMTGDGKSQIGLDIFIGVKGFHNDDGVSGIRSLVYYSPIARRYLRMSTRDGYVFFGNHFAIGPLIANKGKIFFINPFDGKDYVKYEILPQN